MKNKTALRQSVASLKFLAIACPLALLFFWRVPSWGTGILAGMLLLGFIGDAVNVYLIRREVARDPAALDRKIPGT